VTFVKPAWLPPILLTLVIWAMVPFGRTISNALRESGFLRLTLLAAGAAATLGLGRALIGDRTAQSSWAKFLFGAGLIWLLAAFFPEHPEESIHCLQIAILTWLFFRPLTGRPWAWLWAGVLAAAAGTLEEFLQRCTPSRTFDLRDIAVTVLTAALASFTLRFSANRRASVRAS
jgi:hypothetical protein